MKINDDSTNLDEYSSSDQRSDCATTDERMWISEPSHYTQYPIEPKDFIVRNGMEFWRGNIIKYASRAGSKLYDDVDECESEIRDLKKAIRYAEMRINQINGEYCI